MSMLFGATNRKYDVDINGRNKTLCMSAENLKSVANPGGVDVVKCQQIVADLSPPEKRSSVHTRTPPDSIASRTTTTMCDSDSILSLIHI